MKTPMECICPANVPECPNCGRKWEVSVQFGATLTYTSRSVADKFTSLYGKPSRPFEDTHNLVK